MPHMRRTRRVRIESGRQGAVVGKSFPRHLTEKEVRSRGRLQCWRTAMQRVRSVDASAGCGLCRWPEVRRARSPRWRVGPSRRARAASVRLSESPGSRTSRRAPSHALFEVGGKAARGNATGADGAGDLVVRHSRDDLPVNVHALALEPAACGSGRGRVLACTSSTPGRALQLQARRLPK